MDIIPGIVFFILIVFLVTMILASSAPWLPTRRKDMERVLKLATIAPGEVFYDLGCGDGRLVVEASRAGAKAVGLDISLMSYFMSLVRVAAARSRAKIAFKNLFRQNLSDADIVYLFLTPPAMPKIKNKLESELKKGARVISYAFAIPGLELVAADQPPNRQSIYLYRI